MRWSHCDGRLMVAFTMAESVRVLTRVAHEVRFVDRFPGPLRGRGLRLQRHSM